MGKEIKALWTQNSLREWSALVADCRGSGMTVKAWCVAYNVKRSQNRAEQCATHGGKTLLPPCVAFWQVGCLYK